MKKQYELNNWDRTMLFLIGISFVLFQIGIWKEIGLGNNLKLVIFVLVIFFISLSVYFLSLKIIELNSQYLKLKKKLKELKGE